MLKKNPKKATQHQFGFVEGSSEDGSTDDEDDGARGSDSDGGGGDNPRRDTKVHRPIGGMPPYDGSKRTAESETEPLLGKYRDSRQQWRNDKNAMDASVGGDTRRRLNSRVPRRASRTTQRTANAATSTR